MKATCGLSEIEQGFEPLLTMLLLLEAEFGSFTAVCHISVSFLTNSLGRCRASVLRRGG